MRQSSKSNETRQAQVSFHRDAPEEPAWLVVVDGVAFTRHVNQEKTKAALREAEIQESLKEQLSPEAYALVKEYVSLIENSWGEELQKNIAWLKLMIPDRRALVEVACAQIERPAPPNFPA